MNAEIDLKRIANKIVDCMNDELSAMLPKTMCIKLYLDFDADGKLHLLESNGPLDGVKLMPKWSFHGCRKREWPSYAAFLQSAVESRFLLMKKPNPFYGWSLEALQIWTDLAA